MRIIPKDKDWIRQSFLLTEEAVSDEDMKRRILTTAAYKFTDTTLGGNFSINAPPQFTRYADIKQGGNKEVIFSKANGGFRSVSPGTDSRFNLSRGMGRYYSEAIDDNGQEVILRFGVPEYNSLTSFFGGFYNSGASALARTGRGEGIFYAAGKAVGFLLALPFQPLILIGQAIKFFSQTPSSKYYYLKPAMPLYWNAVNTMVNGIAVNMGVIPRVLTEEQEKIYDNPEKYGPDNFAAYNRLLPDIIGKDGAIDVYAISTRAQRLGNANNIKLRDGLDSAFTSDDLKNNMLRHREEVLNSKLAFPPSRGIDKYIESYADLEQNKPSNSKNEDNEQVGDKSQYDSGTGFWDFFEGERRDGASFVTFRVDFSGTAGESFSNSTKESEIAQKINSLSSSSRSSRFNFADGNIGDGLISGLVEGAIGAAKSVITGLADGVQMSGLAALAGSAFVDIPSTWDGSTANLPKADYTIQLRSPYGNKLSRLMNLYIPLAMLLAGALPLSTGRRSYTSPFICECYSKGRVAIRLGMIDSISITRGVGNMGWTQDSEPLGIDVSFSVVDMSRILHMPIVPAFSTTAAIAAAAASAVAGEAGETAVALLAKGTYDDDNSYTDYLAVLGSLGFQDLVYPTRAWRLNLTKQMRSFKAWRSPSHIAKWAMGTLPGRIINAIALGTDRPG